MTDLWCPFADYAPVHGHEHAGPMAGGAAKIVHHTTEGDTIAGAEATYEQTGNLAHFTDSFELGTYRLHQHLPLDQYATALKHPAGTGETNRDNVIQIEHVGHTATSSGWPAGYLDGIAILCRWIELQIGCARVALLPFVPGVVRLPWSNWHNESGHCGHMHVPGNDHVDPGAMDIGYVLHAGHPSPVPNPQPVMELDVQIANAAKTAWLSAADAGIAGLPPNAGYELHADGGVDSVNGAPFYGGYWNKPESVRNAPRVFLNLTPRGDGQAGYVIWGNDGAFYAFGPDLWNPQTQAAA